MKAIKKKIIKIWDVLVCINFVLIMASFGVWGLAGPIGILLPFTPSWELSLTTSIIYWVFGTLFTSLSFYIFAREVHFAAASVLGVMAFTIVYCEMFISI